ncbi:hypothetical protein [Rhizobium sp. ZPR3]|uniref:Integrase n=2 Tax=unclassified Rhizobium TaxID=2613769 RepID=A0AAU7SQR6_9HYPH
MQGFIGADAYRAHKDRRFLKLDDPDMSRNPAFRLSNPHTFLLYERAYKRIAALYYHDRPSLKEILARFASYAERLSRSRRIPADLSPSLINAVSGARLRHVGCKAEIQCIP